MHIILVDNGSLHLKELVKLCGKRRTKVIKPDEISTTPAPEDAVYVLSGGGHHTPVKHHDKHYADELSLIERAERPILGICLGFELIAHQAGGELVRLERPRKGIVEIFPKPEGTNWFGNHSIKASEGHRWVLHETPPGYVALAASTDGIEAIGNLNKGIIGFQFHPEMSRPKAPAAQVFLRALELLGQGR